MRIAQALVIGLLFWHGKTKAESLFIEAESFEQRGGWKLDTQFIREMGSPYLLAHGLGKPVADATMKVQLPAPGTYRVYARTKDWVARWNAPGTPGRFQILVNDEAAPRTFGTEGDDWHWQDGGTIDVESTIATIRLRDLTGFDGRCDAIYLTTGDEVPPNDDQILPAWRRRLLGLQEKPTIKDGYDLVVVGGGYSGMGAAISAARMGCKVALIQDRPVLGGNGSSEVRVWAQGHIRRGKYPRIGEIIEEFADSARKSPGTYEEFGDALKENLVRSEANIDLFLNHHVYDVDVDEVHISAVHAFDTRTSEHKKFSGRLYSDCTGHGTVGFLAGANWRMQDKGRMGMSNMWAWDEGAQPVNYPATPWALDLDMQDFPYPHGHHGQWFWESGFDQDPVNDAEGIRDWNLRAVYGAFNAMKNRRGAEKHSNAFLTWIAYIGGPRESRLLTGDVILQHQDVVTKKQFPDGCVPSTWSVDLHYPKKQYAKKFPDNPFISIAVHGEGVDRTYGYPLPYRCFYSKNINNLFMAGRCISVTHEALGTTRVMKTCGMMGEVVGKASSVCIQKGCYPRDVYLHYWNNLDSLLKLPGKARRDTPDSQITIPQDSMASAGPFGIATGVDPKSLEGIVVDDRQAVTQGDWFGEQPKRGHIAFGYQKAASDSGATCTFKLRVPSTGLFEVRIAYIRNSNFGSRVPVDVIAPGVQQTTHVDMTTKAPLKHNFLPLGQYQLKADDSLVVKIGTANAGGFSIVDAVQLVAVDTE
ncbi:FAD-dependent oxidoreductase [Fuerstiella marisgermanici]|uniref:Fumarate reductase flavoprotein subunit n=1 Tax=Fuerstiella marisgermanici TaxID=1891926 RepID=A0A1P8WCN4_9PLAN|nr:FAD-dependent oxidoreductase [Fuerstiella marisgermanici]APZ91816.1 fumarate reductase flavoprotein subunit [Fuerstiella marisgermanici]